VPLLRQKVPQKCQKSAIFSAIFRRVSLTENGIAAAAKWRGREPDQQRFTGCRSYGILGRVAGSEA